MQSDSVSFGEAEGTDFVKMSKHLCQQPYPDCFSPYCHARVLCRTCLALWPSKDAALLMNFFLIRLGRTLTGGSYVRLCPSARC